MMMWRMSDMRAAEVAVATQHVPQALSADKINLAMAEYENALRAHLLAADDYERSDAEARIAANQKIISIETAAFPGNCDLDDKEARAISRAFNQGLAGNEPGYVADHPAFLRSAHSRSAGPPCHRH